MRGVVLHCCCVVDHFYPHAVGFASVLILARAHCSCLVAVDMIFGALKCFFGTLVIFPAEISRGIYAIHSRRVLLILLLEKVRGERSFQGHNKVITPLPSCIF